MKFPSLVKLPKHRSFDFKPRHYDPIMEDLNERVSKIKEEMGDGENYDAQQRAHISFRNRVNQKGSNQTRFIRLAVIILLVANSYAYFLLGFKLIFKLILLTQLTIAYIWYRIQKGKKNSV